MKTNTARRSLAAQTPDRSPEGQRRALVDLRRRLAEKAAEDPFFADLLASFDNRHPEARQ
jgi:hypothetical protein